jgi:hypothetical protein
MRVLYMVAAIVCAIGSYKHYTEGNSDAGLLCAIACGINISSALRE